VLVKGCYYSLAAVFITIYVVLVAIYLVMLRLRCSFLLVACSDYLARVIYLLFDCYGLLLVYIMYVYVSKLCSHSCDITLEIASV